MSILKNFLKKILSKKTINNLHKLRAITAALFFGFPTKNMKVIGVTGTNGKTTTCHLIAAIFEAAGEKVALATTIQFRIAGRTWKNVSKMTTLSPWQLNSFLAQTRQADCTVGIIETTSHALVQHRVWGIDYDTAVITNLTHDHLDYHQSFGEYRAAKGLLFKRAKHAIVNTDDPEADYFKRLTHHRAFDYGVTNPADMMARKILYQVEKTDFTLVTPTGQIPIELKLPGQFNVLNALAAASVGLIHNIPLETIKRGLESINRVEGRMDRIDAGQPFAVIIDYAHTPDAFEKIYATITPMAELHRSRILHVFGATGDRDKTKRPILGEIAAHNADYLFITDEDPYTEDPMKIMNAVVEGVKRVKRDKRFKGEWYWKILDRREAIRKALSIAGPKDIVLVTGKGAEEAMVIGATHVPWSDRQVIEEELVKLGYSKSSSSM